MSVTTPPMLLPASAGSRSVFPIIGKSIADDDLATDVAADATPFQRFLTNPVTKRSTRVLATLAIGAAVLAIINLTMVPRKITCVTSDDCRQIRRMNTVIVGVRSLLNLIVGFILTFVVLHQAGIDTKALLATAGIVGLVVGLAAQPAMKSFIAGVTYVCTDQFSIGDFISLDLDGAATVKGIVTNFTTQTTTLQNLSGGNLYIPNDNIKVVINYSQNEQRAQVDVHVSHKGDIDVVLHEIQALNTIMATSHVLKGKMTRPPVLKGVTKNGKSSYTVTVTAIAEPMSQIFVERYMRYQLMRLMQRIGVEASTTTVGVDATSSYARAARAAADGTGFPSQVSSAYSRANVDVASTYRPETERGDMSVTSHKRPALAETLRHDADVVYDGHMYRREGTVTAPAPSTPPPTIYGTGDGIDMLNLNESLFV